jgi:hypothetical protein
MFLTALIFGLVYSPNQDKMKDDLIKNARRTPSGRMAIFRLTCPEFFVDMDLSSANFTNGRREMAHGC